MAAAKLADLARPRPLEQCCRVPALDGLLWAGERVRLEGGVYGEVVCFATDLRSVPDAAWAHYSEGDIKALRRRSCGMVQAGKSTAIWFRQADLAETQRFYL